MQILRDPDFIQRRYVQGKDGNVFYTVYDPASYAMSVWMKTGKSNYDETAKSLNAIVWTNGPQMDNPNIKKNTPRNLGIGVFFAGSATAIACKILGVSLLAALGIVGAVFIIAAGGAYLWLKSQAAKFAVFSRTAGDWGQDEGRAYAHWAWFGVEDPYKSYGLYEAGTTGLPPWLDQLCGGMAPLVGSYQEFSSDKNSPRYDPGYAGAVGGGNMAAWGLVPLPVDGEQQDEGSGVSAEDLGEVSLERPDGTTLDGLVVMTGGVGGSARIPGMYAAVGAKVAVATDGSGSAMYGSQQEMHVPNPVTVSWQGREELQRYGMCVK